MAETHVGNLRARFGLNVAPFRQGLAQARGDMDRFVGQIRGLAVGLGAALGVALSGASLRGAMDQIDAQAKLARSLQTTSASVQVLGRAGELAGVGMDQVKQGASDLQRRLSQAAASGGPVADALARINLRAGDLIAMPLDRRVAAINAALREFVPASQRAAVAGQLFGEEGALSITRIDPETIEQARDEIERFGFAISEVDAAKIEQANDALSAIGLATRGLVDRIAVALAPSLKTLAEVFTAAVSAGSPLRVVIDRLGSEIGRITTYVATFLGMMGLRYVGALAASAVATASLSGALLVLRGALLRSGLGLVLVAAGEMVYQFQRLVRASGGFGEAMTMLGAVAKEVWQRIGDGASIIWLNVKEVSERMNGAFLAGLASMQEAWGGFLQMVSRGMSAIPGAGAAVEFLDDAARSAQTAAGSLRDAVAQSHEFAANWASQSQSLRDALGRPLESLQALRALLAENSETVLGLASQDVPALRDALAEAGETGGRAMRDADKEVEKVSESVRGVEQASRNAFRGVLSGAESLRDAVANILSEIRDRLLDSAFNVLWGGSGAGGLVSRLFGAQIGANANGTDNWRGGLTWVHERGGELLDLPSGTRIIPHDLSKRMVDKAADQGGAGGRLSIGFDASIGSLTATMYDVAGRVVSQAAPALVGRSVQAVAAQAKSSKSFFG